MNSKEKTTEVIVMYGEIDSICCFPQNLSKESFRERMK
jgi:hypothetical protein